LTWFMAQNQNSKRYMMNVAFHSLKTSSKVITERCLRTGKLVAVRRIL
jgi:hypothetical protein